MAHGLENSRVLIVDDEQISREVLAQYLAALTVRTDAVESADEAWLRLQDHPDAYDLVLLDLSMPGMSGMELLSRIKHHPLLAMLPVIVQTAASGRSVLNEALRAGALSCLVKPYDQAMLQAVVQTAIRDLRRVRSLRTQLAQGQHVLRLVEQCDFRCQTLDDARQIAAVLAQVCPEPERALLGLYELMVNGIEHGNLGITYEDKSRLPDEAAWLLEILFRQQLPENCDKWLQVRFRRHADHLTIRIEDEGPGFDYARYLDMDPERLYDSHGRGIALSRLMSLDHIQFIPPGNIVEATIKLPT